MIGWASFCHLDQALSLQVVVCLLVVDVSFRVLELFGPLDGMLLRPTFLLETLRHWKQGKQQGSINRAELGHSDAPLTGKGVLDFGDLVKVFGVGQT